MGTTPPSPLRLSPLRPSPLRPSPLRPPPADVEPTALAAALARIGDRWTLLLVAAMLTGPQRFNDLLTGVPGLAPNVLSQRLKALERHGLVVGRPYSDRPRRVAYDLSGSGRELAGALRLLAVWGAGAAPDADPLRHASCGTALETRWHCPTCDIDVDDPAADDLTYV